MIHVVIPVYNRLNYTIECISSLDLQSNRSELNIIVVDDSSTDGTADYLKKNHPKITILKGSGELYWGGAVHYGIEYVLKVCKPDDWLLLVNNDVELSKGAISNLVEISSSLNRCALVSSITVNAEDRRTIIKTGTKIQSWIFNKTKHVFSGMKIEEVFDKGCRKVDLLTGRCLLHPVEVFMIAGNYDSETFIHYMGDDEFSMRVKKYGYSTYICPSSVVYLKPNKILPGKTDVKSLWNTLFGLRSSSNIINKLNLTIKVVPFYAKLTYFLIGVVKSVLVYFKSRF